MGGGRQPIDRFADELAPETQTAVAKSTSRRTQLRADLLRRDYGDPDPLRRLAAISPMAIAWLPLILR